MLHLSEIAQISNLTNHRASPSTRLTARLIPTFSVIGKFGTSEIERIDEEKRKSTSSTTGENVGAKFLPLWSSFWGGEDGLDLIFEGKVQSLGWEVSDAVSKIS